jgi:hypothetical protein
MWSKLVSIHLRRTIKAAQLALDSRAFEGKRATRRIIC